MKNIILAVSLLTVVSTQCMQQSEEQRRGFAAEREKRERIRLRDLGYGRYKKPNLERIEQGRRHASNFPQPDAQQEQEPHAVFTYPQGASEIMCCCTVFSFVVASTIFFMTNKQKQF